MNSNLVVQKAPASAPSIDIINITKTPAVLHDIDATKVFNLVINGIALLALRSLGFPESLMTTIGKLWSGQRCHVKTAYRVSTSSYRSTLAELIYGLGQEIMSATDIWGVLHGFIIHAVALAFVGILLLSIPGLVRHERIGEKIIDDTGLGTTNPHPTLITPMSQKVFTNEEHILNKKANVILQFFLNLLCVIG
jgi:hypothetical protein